MLPIYHQAILPPAHPPHPHIPPILPNPSSPPPILGHCLEGAQPPWMHIAYTARKYCKGHKYPHSRREIFHIQLKTNCRERYCVCMKDSFWIWKAGKKQPRRLSNTMIRITLNIAKSITSFLTHHICHLFIIIVLFVIICWTAVGWVEFKRKWKPRALERVECSPFDYVVIFTLIKLSSLYYTILLPKFSYPSYLSLFNIIVLCLIICWTAVGWVQF